MAQGELFPNLEKVDRVAEPVATYKRTKPASHEPPNLGKAIGMIEPDDE